MTETRTERIAEVLGLSLFDRPKPLIRMPYYDKKAEDWKWMVGQNCCYLIQHKDVFDAIWKEKHSAAEDPDQCPISR